MNTAAESAMNGSVTKLNSFTYFNVQGAAEEQNDVPVDGGNHWIHE